MRGILSMLNLQTRIPVGVLFEERVRAGVGRAGCIIYQKTM